jgi:hypothetical protein
MPSLHDIMARPAVGLLMNHFGEPDIEPGSPFAIYRSPQVGKAELFLKRPSVSQLSVQPLFDPETGETCHRERRDLFEEASTFIAAGIVGPERGAKVKLPDGEWVVDVGESTWDGLLVKLALARRILVGQQEMRRADV